MRTYIKSLIATTSLLFFTTIASAQYITIDNSKTPEQLIRDLIPANSCVQATNITISGWDFGGGEKSYASFDSNTSGFPLEKGLVITTGKATSAIGPNSFLLSEGPSSWPGDNDLEQAIGENNTINATAVEFDFIAVTNTMSFDYIFSSEQYLSNPSSNQCNYSDGFAFLLRENSATQYQNLAVVPGTNIPVKVTTVRGSGTICPPANTQYFDAFNGNAHPTNFNGQTKIMRAEATVIPGASYHIKMVIADQGNNLYDSAIFIGGDSFSNEIVLGEDHLIADGNPLCNGENLALTPDLVPGASSYTWLQNNTPIPGYTNVSSPNYTITAAGDYTLTANLDACEVSGTIRVEYASVTVNDAALVQCDDNNDGISVFNLTDAAEFITGGNPDLSIVGYYESGNTTPISDPENFQNISTNTISVEVQNQFQCTAFATLTLQIANNSLTPIDPVEVCDGDNVQDGLYEFDLDTISQEIQNNNALPGGASIHYFLTAQDAVSFDNELSTPYSNTTANQQIIHARIVNGPDCYGILPVTLVVNTFSPADFEDESPSFCDGNTLILNPGSGYSSYSWNTTPIQTSQTITVSHAGTYSVTVTNNEGCSAVKNYFVTSSGTATITDIEVTSFSGNNNSITIHVSGLGDYEFSLDNINYQDSNVFTNLYSGEYTVYVHDKNDCGMVFQSTYVLDYPRFFTPNGDGYNDTWRIKNLEIDYPGSQLLIFNRYGKLLKQISASGEGWNGTFNNQTLPSDDYWFTLKLENGRIIKGHFSLKR
nr:T9SS type B sorting domain-containing protein [uncultured Flavobacterium sp.]